MLGKITADTSKERAKSLLGCPPFHDVQAIGGLREIGLSAAGFRLQQNSARATGERSSPVSAMRTGTKLAIQIAAERGRQLVSFGLSPGMAGGDCVRTMSDVNEVEAAQAIVTEMLEHANAQRELEAIASAKEVLRREREFKNQGIRAILQATAWSTLLTCEAELSPGDLSLVERCDQVFELFSGSGVAQMQTTAITALGVKIDLLLQAHQPLEAERVSQQLASFYADRPDSTKLAEQSAEVVRIALNMVAMRAPAAAASLAQRVVDRLAAAESFDDRVLAATAQAWIVIATMARDDALDRGFAVPPATAGELRAVLEADDPPGLPKRPELDELIAMGDAAVTAIQALLPRLAHYGPNWDNARFLMMMLQFATLSDLGRREESRAIEESVIEEFGNRDDWRYSEFMRWIQHDLDTPS